jgi:ferredoxin
MRVGAVVARVSIPPTPRPYSDHRAYCLFFAKGTCGKCIDRCPVRAISAAGHDKEKCRQHLARSREHVKKTYKFEGYGCGQSFRSVARQVPRQGRCAPRGDRRTRRRPGAEFLVVFQQMGYLFPETGRQRPSGRGSSATVPFGSP